MAGKKRKPLPVKYPDKKTAPGVYYRSPDSDFPNRAGQLDQHGRLPKTLDVNGTQVTPKQMKGNLYFRYEDSSLGPVSARSQGSVREAAKKAARRATKHKNTSSGSRKK